MNIYKYLVVMHYLLFVVCLFGCNKKQKTELESALDEAGKNKIELEIVLKHYLEDPKDSLKYKAACFLIENMKYHSYYEGYELNKYYKYFECIKERKIEVKNIIDSLIRVDGKFNIYKLKIKEDLKNIKSEYLINNIDWAFKVWKEQPWGKNVVFEDFCEYILPYRVGDEIPLQWREKLYCEYNSILHCIKDSTQASDPIFVAKFLFDSITKTPVTFTELLPKGPHIGPQCVNYRTGTCREMSDIIIYIFRALGIPCGVDYMIRGDNNANHFWNIVKSKKGDTYIIELADNEFRAATTLWNPKGKVFRHTFSLNKSILRSMRKSSNKIHPNFKVPLFLDVTSDYTGEWNKNLILSTNILYEKVDSTEILYLCISRHLDWIPIDWALPKNDCLIFSNIEGNIIAQLGKWNGFKLKMLSDPFFIDKETNNIKFYRGVDTSETVQLYFKYHLYTEPFRLRMINGVFEGSNDENFLYADTLLKIETAPERLYTTNYITSEKKKYRYVRYKGGEDSYCNIAEIEFYSMEHDFIQLRGKIIGTAGCWQGDGSHEYTKAFDGDPYTSFDYTSPSSGWTGLDLGSAHSINKIRYVPRNRDNFIRKGDNYELFYWTDKKWNSAGIQEAKADSLVYEVPEKSLLYLKNHTRGKDERIFEYKNQKQVFW